MEKNPVYAANVRLNQERQDHFRTNIGRYVAEHPGEWILIDPRMQESFYRNRRSAKRKSNQAPDFGPGYFMAQIPCSMQDYEQQEVRTFEEQSRQTSIMVKRHLKISKGTHKRVERSRLQFD